MRLALLALLLVLSSSSSAGAQEALQAEPEPQSSSIYGYVDTRGAWHFVDSLAMVPSQYHQQAEANAMPVSEPAQRAKPNSSPATTLRPSVQPPSVQAEVRREGPTDDELRRRRNELLSDLAALEEGNVPGDWLDEAGEGGLTEGELDRRLTALEDELAEIDKALGD